MALLWSFPQYSQTPEIMKRTSEKSNPKLLLKMPNKYSSDPQRSSKPKKMQETDTSLDKPKEPNDINV